MALTENGGTGMYMPVAPAYGGGYGNGGLFGGDGAWWIIVLLLCGFGGWGMGGFGGGMMWPMMMGGMGGGFGLDYLYPWLNNSQHMSDGFRDQQLNSQIGDLRTDVNRGFGDVQLGLAGLGRQICETGNGITGAVRDGFYGAEIAASNRQMANMQQGFGIQAGISDLKYTVATENCADRAAISDGIRDVITNQTAGVQRILDQMCADKIDAKNEKIADLERQLTAANLAASQIAQTSQIVDQTYNRLSTCPVGTVPVYGEQPIFRCNNNGCGCGGNIGGFNGNF